jgi:hypothetical protein
MLHWKIATVDVAVEGLRDGCDERERRFSPGLNLEAHTLCDDPSSQTRKRTIMAHDPTGYHGHVSRLDRSLLGADPQSISST